MTDAARPILSVVVVSWNTRDLLHRCLATIPEGTGDVSHEILVVDNDSGDGSADMVGAEFPSVRLIRNRDNRGFGTACNQGAAGASGRVLLFLNPDAEAAPGAMARLVSFLDEHPEVAVVGPLIVTGPDGRPGLTYGHDPSVMTALLPLLRPLASLAPGLGDLHALGVVPPTPGPDAAPRDVPYVSGASLTLRRSIFEEVGGFDEEFFLYLEETDLCRRIRQAGSRVVYLPHARVLHREGASRDKRSGAALAQFYRSLDRFLAKHYTPSYGARVRAAMRLGFRLRYLATSLMGRREQARYYRENLQALSHDP